MNIVRKTLISFPLVLLCQTVGATQASAESGKSTDHFVLVKGGTFEMGDVMGDGNFAMGETPIHKVTLGDYLLAKHEITVGDFRKFVTATGYQTMAETDTDPRSSGPIERNGKTFRPSWKQHWFDQTENEPAVLIAWEDAVNYCNWLSRQAGLPPAYDVKTWRLLDGKGSPTSDVRQAVGFRLPTEAEWEFAARERGRKVRFGNGQDIARAEEINFDAAGTSNGVPSLRLPPENRHPYNEPGATRDVTTPVGTFRPNALGLFDMSGNAWEWCCDTGGYDYTSPDQVNPCVQDTKGHILRGGTYFTDAKACRVTSRIDWGAGARCTGSGFRVARTVEPSQ